MMSREEALAFLGDGVHTGKLATASASGAPHVAPVWYALDGDDLVFTTNRDTVKGRHLLANPRAAVTVDDERFPFSSVSARGPVVVEEHSPELLEWATRVAARYVPEGQAEAYGKRNAVDTELLCRLRLERISGVRDIAS
jgi:PPOX class probable F420-dependent enzyme